MSSDQQAAASPDHLPPPPQLAALHAALEDVRASAALPIVVVLHGETGRGKTYAIQRLFDDLVARYPGYWEAGLAPDWPPDTTRKLHRQRKRVDPKRSSGSDSDPPFLWLGVGAPASEGAAVVDMSVAFAEQVRRVFDDVIRSASRRDKKLKVLASAAADALGALNPWIGVGKILFDRTRDAIDAFGPERDPYVELRRSLFEAHSAVARCQPSPAPLIVVLDDVQGADYETLYMASSLLTPDPAVGDRILPSLLDAVSPAPTLIVCTAWEHRIGGSFADPFDQWLDELAELGVEVRWEPCTDMAPDHASSILRTAGLTIGDEALGEIVQHLTVDANGVAAVTPLVLAEAVARIWEVHDPVTDEHNVDHDFIRRLSTSPEQHVRDRVENLREVPGIGRAAVSMLELAASYARRFPEQLLAVAAARSTDPDLLRDVIAQLEGHGIITRTQAAGTNGVGAPGRLNARGLDADVFRYLAKALDNARPPAMHQCATALMLWVTEVLLPHEFDDAAVPRWAELVGLLRPAAELVHATTAVDGPLDLDAFVIASVLLDDSVDDSILRGASNISIGLAYQAFDVGDVSDDVLLDAAHHYGNSRVTARLLERRFRSTSVNTGRELTSYIAQLGPELVTKPVIASALAQALADAGDVEHGVELLMAVRDRSTVISRLARLLVRAGRRRDAIDCLGPFAHQSQETCIALADLLARDGRVDEAISVLQPAAGRFQEAAMRLAQLLIRTGRIDAAIEVLRPSVPRFQQAGLELARLLKDAGRQDEAIEILQPAADRFGNVVTELARMLDETGRVEDAVRVLTTGSRRFEQAAAALGVLLARERRLDEAIAALAPLAGTSQGVAVQLASLLDDAGRHEEAIEVLRPLATRFEHVATELAARLQHAGRRPEAIEVLRPLATRFERAACELAKCLEEDGHVDEAIVVLERLVPSSQAAAIDLARLLRRCGRVDDAIGVLRAGATRFEQVAVECAELLEASGRIADAIEVLVPMAEHFDRPAIDLAALLERDGRPSEAIAVLQSKARASERVLINLSAALERSGRVDEAVDALRRDADPNPRTRIALARLLARNGRRDDAIDSVRDLSLQSADAAAEYADLLISVARTDEALELLAKIPRSSHARLEGVRLAAHLVAHGDWTGQQVKELPSPRWHAMIALVGTLARGRRSDKLSALALGVEGDRTLRLAVAAVVVERAARETSTGRRRSARRFAREIWNPVEFGRHVPPPPSAIAIATTVKHWARDPALVRVPLTAMQALSCTEVAVALTRRSGLERAVMARLVEISDREPRLIAAMASVSDVSPIAAAVVATLSGDHRIDRDRSIGGQKR